MANDETTGWVDSLFRSVDARDTGAFVSFLCDDVSFRFGNAPVVNGRSAVATVVGGFFESIDGDLSWHGDLHAQGLEHPDGAICQRLQDKRRPDP